eukprot:2736897-Amphidinium_carterae.1
MSGIKPDSNGELPAGKALREAAYDTSVRVLLLPLPSPNSSKPTAPSQPSAPAGAQVPASNKRRQQQHQQQKRPRTATS